MSEEIERITRVAMRSQNGKMICTMAAPSRHHNIIHALADGGYSAGDIAEFDQGFFTSKNRFVDRKEAFKIATEANQIVKRHENHVVAPGGQLYSEDLW